MILYLILERKSGGEDNYLISFRDNGPRHPRMYNSLSRAKSYCKNNPAYRIKKVYTDTLPEVS